MHVALSCRQPNTKVWGVIPQLPLRMFPDLIEIQILEARLPRDKDLNQNTKLNATKVRLDRRLTGLERRGGQVVRDHTGKPSIIQTSKIVFEYDGDHLPVTVTIKGIKQPIRTEPYVFQPQICTTCLAYTHSTKNCQSKISRCGHCGKKGHTFNTCRHKTNTEMMKCANCQSDTHRAN